MGTENYSNEKSSCIHNLFDALLVPPLVPLPAPERNDKEAYSFSSRAAAKTTGRSAPFEVGVIWNCFEP